LLADPRGAAGRRRAGCLVWVRSQTVEEVRIRCSPLLALLLVLDLALEPAPALAIVLVLVPGLTLAL